MDGRQIQRVCRADDFPSVEAILRDWEEVESVGSLFIKRNNKNGMTTVYITFTSAEAAKAAEGKLDAIKEFNEDKSNEKKDSKKPAPSARKDKNLANEFLKHESYEDIKRNQENARRAAERAQEHAGRKEERGGRRGGRGTGRGGPNGQRRQDGQGRGRGRRQQHQRLPPMEANVAFGDNIPFGTTNSHLMELFGQYGRVLDINRLETMAMICYDNPESVQQSIQHLNGTQIKDSIITVSSGTVRIPGQVAVQLGM